METGIFTDSALLREKQEFFQKGHTRPYSFRKEQLKRLRKSIEKHEKEIILALQQDLKKPETEAFSSEIGFVYREIDHTLRNLKQWMEPESISASIINFPSKAKVYNEPKGVALIIAPWNYPFQLQIAPLIGAIAGGNCAVCKPSEETPETARIIWKVLSEAFDDEYVSVILGHGSEVIPPLLDEFRFDHIFFTGSVSVGKKIMQQASAQLTPVTLELGGKSPVVVDSNTRLDVAARRIAWGKFMNAGQTCVSPDYVLVKEEVKDRLVEKLKKTIIEFYGEEPKKSGSYGRIINEKQFDKVSAYISQGKVLCGGRFSKEDLYIEPTILEAGDPEQPVMNEEIFGPVLPVKGFEEVQDAIDIICRNPFPLSMYIFSEDENFQQIFTKKIRFGGGCINNTILHLSEPDLPFGGTGYSGMGSYHGKASFDVFTYKKSVLNTGTWFDLKLKYPPYSARAGKLMKRIFK